MTARRSASQLDMNSKKIIEVGAPSNPNDAARKADVDTSYNNAISRANHTGTQTASTISNFDTQVRANRLDQMSAPTAPVSMNSQRVTSVAAPTVDGDAANKKYVDDALAGLVSGMERKGGVKVAVGENVNIANPGTSTLDGVSVSSGDIVLLYGQTDGTQNGPYVFNGSGVGMTRAANWDTAGEAVIGSFWIVAQGTLADHFALMTNDSFVLGSDEMDVQFVGVAPTASAPFGADLGDGSATVFNCDHNFNTRAVHVTVYRNASPYDEPLVYIAHPTVNRVTIEPDDVWSSGQYHVVISRA
ncbi:hypothetical protein SEA_ESSENCE_112 [Mycobacterium phage Essence]|nr:hypothetical protein SEA_ESSENCE_112 [Mycobacterium phage Essence]